MDDLLEAVRQKAADEGYTVYGELGREHDADVWYLARERASGKLVAMRLHTEQVGPGGHKDYALEVANELNGSVSVGLAECPSCHTPVRRWGRFCTRCGANLADSGQALSPGERQDLLERVRKEAADLYEILGEMPWSGGGAVFFALERATGRLVRLRIKSEGGADVLGETRALMPLVERVNAGYLTSIQPAVPPEPPSVLRAAAPPSPTPFPRAVPAVPPVSGPQVGLPSPPVIPPPAVAIPAPPPKPPRQAPKAPPKSRIDWGAPFSTRERLLLGVIVVLALVLAGLVLS
jgi:hypothetical protein